MKYTGPIFRTDEYSSDVNETCSKHESSAHSHMNSVNIGLSFVAVESTRSFTSRNSDSLRAARSCRDSVAIASSILALVEGPDEEKMPLAVHQG
jgi:hypothetical protein